jgi:HAD superfamily hydrolase (TIGR01509 family)
MLKAAFFDVGDTLLRASVRRAALLADACARLAQRFGPRDWYRDFLEADHLQALLSDDPAEPLRQRTAVVLARWLDARGIGHDDIDLEELRRRAEFPRRLSATLAPGAHPTLANLKARGLRIGVISNTLWTGDEELRADLPDLGLVDVVDVVVTSHTTGFRKPHPAIFQRALAVAGVVPHESFMVGDEPYADVYGAKQIGMRAVWLRRPPPRPHPVGAPRDAALETLADAAIDELPELDAVARRWRG